jgi:hypothetical protein
MRGAGIVESGDSQCGCVRVSECGSVGVKVAAPTHSLTHSLRSALLSLFLSNQST